MKCVSKKEVHHFGIPTARTVEQERRTKVQLLVSKNERMKETDEKISLGLDKAWCSTGLSFWTATFPTIYKRSTKNYS